MFGISGIGHFYIGKITRGAAFLVGTIVLYWAGVSLLWVGVPTVMIGVGIPLLGFGVILLVAALVLFVWSVFNVRSLCKTYNEHVAEHGRAPPDW